MCTAIAYNAKTFFFGRTLDADRDYGAEVVVMPRKFPLSLRYIRGSIRKYAVVGAAIVSGGYPLFFDGMNERGLCAAGLNFIGNAHYFPAKSGKTNLAQFEFIPYVLGSFASADEAAAALENINITPESFSPDLPPAELHWLIADGSRTLTVECTSSGLNVYENPAGVLTNNPPFLYHMQNLANYMSLSARPPQNNFAKGLSLSPYGAGLGAFGLPGDFSPQSRFVRAAFVRGNAPASLEGEEALGMFFDVLSSVEVPRGACGTENGGFYTRYSCCMDAFAPRTRRRKFVCGGGGRRKTAPLFGRRRTGDTFSQPPRLLKINRQKLFCFLPYYIAYAACGRRYFMYFTQIFCRFHHSATSSVTKISH